MDEQLHHIDRLFKKAVEEHSELPSSTVWENLEKNLQRKNATSIYKKYKKWKWVAAALFVFSVALGMYTLHLNLKYKKVSEKKHSNDSVNNIGFGQRSQGDERIVGNLQDVRNENKKTKLENIPADPSSNVEQTRNNRPVKKSASIKTEVNSNKTVEQGPGLSQTSTAIAKRKPTNKTEKFENHAVFQKKIKLTVTKKLPLNNTEVAGSDMSKNVSNNKPSGNPNSSTEKEASTGYIHTTNASIVSKNIDLSIREIQIPTSASPSSLLPTAETAKAGKSKVRPFSVTLNRGKFTGSVYYSQNLISTNMQTNNPDFREDNYLQIKSHEKMHAEDVVGLSLVTDMGKRIGIETGVSLHTFITDINAKPLVARKDNNGRVNYRISSSSGYAYYAVKNRPTPPLADSIRTISSTSTVKYISVPIGLQYHLYAGKKLSISPAIALSASFLTKGKITTIQSLEHTYSSDIEGLKPYYFDGTFRLNICYYLSKRLGINLVPSSGFALSDVTETKPVITRRNTVGIAAALSFSFR